MAITTINQDNFEEKVTNAASPVLLDFWAAWCGPCTMLSPVVEELAQEHPEISFGKVNVHLVLLMEMVGACSFAVCHFPPLTVPATSFTPSNVVSHLGVTAPVNFSAGIVLALSLLMVTAFA